VLQVRLGQPAVAAAAQPQGAHALREGALDPGPARRAWARRSSWPRRAGSPRGVGRAALPDATPVRAGEGKKTAQGGAGAGARPAPGARSGRRERRGPAQNRRPKSSPAHKMPSSQPWLRNW
jgi:hypothetical protein